MCLCWAEVLLCWAVVLLCWAVVFHSWAVVHLCWAGALHLGPLFLSGSLGLLLPWSFAAVCWYLFSIFQSLLASCHWIDGYSVIWTPL